MAANNHWIGGAAAVAQVDTLTPGGTIEAGDLFNITLTDEAGATAALSVAATGTTVNQTVVDIVAAFNASTDPRFTAITAAPVGTVGSYTAVRLTADTAGVPFYCSVATTETGGGAADDQTFARAATTANSGPNDWNTAANWYTRVVPVSTDSVWIDGRSTTAIYYGLRQTAVTLAALRITRACAYDVGTLEEPLNVGATLMEIGRAPDDGSNPTMASTVNVASSNIQTAIHVFGSRNLGSSGKAPINVGGTHASNVLNVYGGIVSAGGYVDGEAATFATINVEGGSLTVGSGVTATTITADNDATVLVECAATTITQYGTGRLTTRGSGAITTATVSGTANLNSTGTITTLNVQEQGLADFTGNCAARTVTNANVYGMRARLTDDNKSVTFTNGVDCRNGARTSQVNLGPDVTVTPSAL
jgi:hypothetical protein